MNERSDDNGDFSYDMLTTDEFNGEDILIDEAADTAGQAERNLLLDKLRLVISGLSDDERQFLDALYYQGLTERDWSAQSGIPQKTINDRKKRPGTTALAIWKCTAKKENTQSRLDEIFTILEGLENHPMEYDDRLVRQVLECVVVESKEKIKVIFAGGLEVEQATENV